MSAHRSDPEALLRSVRHEADDAPPFDRVWAAARDLQRHRRARRRTLLLTAVPLSAALLLLVLLFPTSETGKSPTRSSEVAPSDEYELAQALSDWRAPLDFLLEPPGGGLLGVGPPAAELPLLDDLPTLDSEEVL